MRHCSNIFGRFVLIATTIGLSSSSALAQYDGSLTVPESLASGFDSISAEQSEAWLSILAGPGFEGRGTGQLGYVRAAHWVAGKLAEFGLEPMGDGGTYFQMLPMTRLNIDASQSKLIVSEELSIPFSQSIGLDRFANQAEIAGKLVFVKLAGESPQLEDGVLRDKVVIYVTDEQNLGRAPMLIGRQRPACALRLVDSEPKSTSQLQRGNSGSRFPFVSGTIAKAALEKIRNATKSDEAWLSLGDDPKTEVHATESHLKLELRIREEPAAVPNVLAWQPGSDPALQDEYIVIGAHLDHLGLQGGTLFPGADDNGSGSTAVLNIAKAIATNPVKPKRSVLFMWFAAEEIGLVGSAHYCDHPILPLDKMVCMLNIDMVGRNEEKNDEAAADNENSLHLIGSQKGDQSLHDVIMEANKYVNLTFEYDEESVFGRSDQANFYRKGTSVAFLFGGFHPDYHRPTDDPAKINYKKIASAARLYYITLHLAADHGPFKLPENQSSKP